MTRLAAGAAGLATVVPRILSRSSAAALLVEEVCGDSALGLFLEPKAKASSSAEGKQETRFGRTEEVKGLPTGRLRWVDTTTSGRPGSEAKSE